MKIKSFSQIGKRTNNEDFIGFNDNVVTVCDGMGGHTSGEIASRFVVENILHIFSDKHKELSKSEIQEKLDSVQLSLCGLLQKNPELENMGTTFTGIFITDNVWYAAHIGDSRIYLFRPSEKKLWHTWDHSLVGELMRNGDITCEGGRFHPMSNRISKAMIATRENKTSTASVVKFDNLQQGDIFLLCSDGVVEAWGDKDLKDLISDTSISFDEKCERLRRQCEQLSKDNNSAIMLEIEKQDAFSYGSNEEIEWTSFADVDADYARYMKEQMPDEANESQPAEPETEPVTIISSTNGKKCRLGGSRIAIVILSLLLLFSLALNAYFVLSLGICCCGTDENVEVVSEQAVEKPVSQQPAENEEQKIETDAEGTQQNAVETIEEKDNQSSEASDKETNDELDAKQ
ncbi:MAG: protein phosphatase 2C domain-containing protein [Bacteroidales bacterium]|nr:protein phosphatase 2C domain-containing protein [Bacteroidales bacterium]